MQRNIIRIIEENYIIILYFIFYNVIQIDKIDFLISSSESLFHHFSFRILSFGQLSNVTLLWKNLAVSHVYPTENLQPQFENL